MDLNEFFFIFCFKWHTEHTEEEDLHAEYKKNNFIFSLTGSRKDSTGKAEVTLRYSEVIKY